MIECSKCGVDMEKREVPRRNCCRSCYNTYMNEAKKKYRANPENKRKELEYSYKYKKEKRKKDPVWAAIQNTRAGIYKFLRLGGDKKLHTIEDYIGYPLKVLAEWAKVNGYNPPFNNIEHKIPLAFWRKKYPNNPKKATRAAYRIENLQIMDAIENREKGDKILPHYKHLMEA